MAEHRPHDYDVLDFYHTLIGPTFVASVHMGAQYQVVPEEDGVWLFGVHPGGIAAGGVDFGDALNYYTCAMIQVLEDFAEQFHTFDAFKEEVERFFYQCDAETLEEVGGASPLAWVGVYGGPLHGKALERFGSDT